MVRVIPCSRHEPLDGGVIVAKKKAAKKAAPKKAAKKVAKKKAAKKPAKKSGCGCKM
jgi:hypothetical protein